MAMGKSFQAISCSLSTALLTWSPSCQPPCHTPPAALPADWACIPCRSAGPRSTCQPPARAQWAQVFTGSPTLLPPQTHLSPHAIFPEDRLQESTTVVPPSSFLPQNGTCVYPLALMTSGEHAHHSSYLSGLQMHPLVLPQGPPTFWQATSSRSVRV